MDTIVNVSLFGLFLILQLESSISLSVQDNSLRIAQLEDKIRDLRKELKKQESITKELQKALNSTIKNNEKRQVNGDCIGAENDNPVVFSVRLTKTLYPLGKNQIITYDHIITNVGQGYESTTGIFEAPYGGLYQIIATMWSTNGYSVDIEMIHNGQDVCYAKTTSRNNTMGMCATVLLLNDNERVWVRHLGTLGNYAYGNEYATFSGHRIM